jgi:chloramphenicol-sensitive protein RarD
MQFLIGVLLLHEEMTPPRLVGFIIVWVALVILSVDTFRASRAARRARLEPVVI